MLDSGAEGPGFKSQPRRCRAAVLGKLFIPTVPLFTKQQNWYQPSVDEVAGHSSQFCSGITSNFPSRAFSVSAPSTWNSLPAHIRSIDTLSTFKRHLNSISSSLPLPSSHPVPAPQIRSHDFWRYINLCVCMYVCMYVFCNRSNFCHPSGSYAKKVI